MIGNCYACKRTGVEVETSYEHGGQVRCAPCAAKPHRKPRVYDGEFDVPVPDSAVGPAAPAMPERLTIRASEVPSRSIRWVWEGRLALGYPAVQTGIEGLGKSVFVCWLISQLTLGKVAGEFTGRPIDVLVVADEDGIGDVWRPRLELAGADLDRVHFLNLADLPADWNVRDGIVHIREAVSRTKARLVFVDALLEHMPEPKAGESINSATWVRKALRPFKAFLQLHEDVAGLYSMHPPKGRPANFRDLVQSSQAFSAIPRTGLLFGYHPEDADLHEREKRRVLLRGKGNLGADPGALTFRVVGKPFKADDGRITEREVVEDVHADEISLAELMGDLSAAREPPKLERAGDFIRAFLADGEWHESQPVIDGLGAMEISDRTARRARERLGAQVRKRPGETDGPWEWRLEPKGPNDLPGVRAHARDISPSLSPSPETSPNPAVESEAVNWSSFSGESLSEGEGDKARGTARAPAREAAADWELPDDFQDEPEGDPW